MARSASLLPVLYSQISLSSSFFQMDSHLMLQRFTSTAAHYLSRATPLSAHQTRSPSPTYTSGLVLAKQTISTHSVYTSVPIFHRLLSALQNLRVVGFTLQLPGEFNSSRCTGRLHTTLLLHQLRSLPFHLSSRLQDSLLLAMLHRRTFLQVGCQELLHLE